MKVYTPNDRKFLGQDTGLFLILRFVLQTLAQTRLSRVSIDTKFTDVQDQFRILHAAILNSKSTSLNEERNVISANRPRNGNNFSIQLDRIMERLNNIEALRQSDLDNLQSTLITACTPKEGSGLSDPVEEKEDLVIEDNSESCPPCKEFSVHKEVARHLKICATVSPFPFQ